MDDQQSTELHPRQETRTRGIFPNIVSVRDMSTLQNNLHAVRHKLAPEDPYERIQQ